MSYDPMLTMSALNLAVVSLHRITCAQDRVILDQEYRSIINNLRMGEINADPELTSLYQEIVRVINRGRLRDELRAEIEAVYSLEKQKSIKDIISGNLARSFNSNTLVWLGKLAASCATEYFRTKAKAELHSDAQNLRLKSEELDEYSELQRKLLGSSWQLLRKYTLSDGYRLTQNGLEKFYSAMQEANPSKRRRMLKYIAGEFEMYAPYWYYCGMAALESGNAGEAEKFFGKFEEVWRPVLRKDPYKAEVLKYRINVLVKSGISEGNAGEIMQCLADMRDNTELEDWANNIYMGMMYFALGHKDRAEECVMCNIDFGYESEVSSKVLAKFEAETPTVKFVVHEGTPETTKSEPLVQDSRKPSVWGSFMKWLKPEQSPTPTLPPVKVNPPQPVITVQEQPAQEEKPKVDARYYRLMNEKTLRKKADKGDSEAQYHLGLKCEKKDSLNDALTWYKKAADQGHSQAKEAYIALSLRQGDNCVEHDSNDEAARFYDGAAKMGSQEAKHKLSEIRKPEAKPESPAPPSPPPAPEPKPKREKVDMHLLREQARHGVTEAEFQLASIYDARTKYLSATLRVITWIAIVALAVVGILHMSFVKFVASLAGLIGGNWLLWRTIEGVQARTRELYRKAAEKGNPDAQYQLGRVLERRNKDRRIHDMLPGFAAFCGILFVVVGFVFLKFTSWLWCVFGLLISGMATLWPEVVDFEEFDSHDSSGDSGDYVNWYLKAALNGHVDAQYTIGLIRDEQGKYQEAHDWFTKAAQKGHSGAEAKLRTFGSQYRQH